MSDLQDRVHVPAERCPFCHDAIPKGEAPGVCAACHALHHADCLAEHGACSACGVPVPGGPARPARPPAQPAAKGGPAAPTPHPAAELARLLPLLQAAHRLAPRSTARPGPDPIPLVLVLIVLGTLITSLERPQELPVALVFTAAAAVGLVLRWLLRRRGWPLALVIMVTIGTTLAAAGLGIVVLASQGSSALRRWPSAALTGWTLVATGGLAAQLGVVGRVLLRRLGLGSEPPAPR